MNVRYYNASLAISLCFIKKTDVLSKSLAKTLTNDNWMWNYAIQGAFLTSGEQIKFGMALCFQYEGSSFYEPSQKSNISSAAFCHLSINMCDWVPDHQGLHTCLSQQKHIGPLRPRSPERPQMAKSKTVISFYSAFSEDRNIVTVAI